MKIFLNLLAILGMLASLIVVSGCAGPAKKPETEPQVVPKEPSIEELRKPVAKDPTIYKAREVILEYGRFKKKYISYKKYRELAKGQGGALDPDWFYDSYDLDLKEKGHWITVTYGTSKRAKDRDPRIQELMADLPGSSIIVKLKTPGGRSYVLSDAEADGILDFAKEANKKTGKKIDIQLLDRMQEKYTWIIGLIKKHYKKIKKNE